MYIVYTHILYSPRVINRNRIIVVALFFLIFSFTCELCKRVFFVDIIGSLTVITYSVSNALLAPRNPSECIAYTYIMFIACRPMCIHTDICTSVCWRIWRFSRRYRCCRHIETRRICSTQFPTARVLTNAYVECYLVVWRHVVHDKNTLSDRFTISDTIFERTAFLPPPTYAFTRTANGLWTVKPLLHSIYSRSTREVIESYAGTWTKP